jgi:hypothetical protein
MIVEALARVGHAVRSARQDVKDLIYDLTDVASPRAGSFLYHVVLVECDPARGRVAVHPDARWAEERTDGRRRVGFEPDRGQPLAAVPFTVTVAGNPLLPQGVYPVPAYRAYGARPKRPESQLQTMASSADEAYRFLAARLRQTLSGVPPRASWRELAEAVQGALARQRPPDEDDALLVVVVPAEEGPYGLLRGPVPSAPGVVPLAQSLLEPGATLVARLPVVLEAVLAAKAQEAVEGGGEVADGRCAVCGRAGRAVSIYSSNWTWYTTTWEAPLPQELGPRRLAEGVAVCEACYGDLLVGANAFKGTSRPLLAWLNQELFSQEDGASVRQAERIAAGLLVVPVASDDLRDPERAREYVQGLEHLVDSGNGSGHERHLDALLGAEFVLPEELDAPVYRLHVLYYVAQNADVQLRATLEDMVPTVLAEVAEQLQEAVAEQAAVLDAVHADRRRWGSLPFLLLRAYGRETLWIALQDALHRRPLSWRAAVHRTVRRLGAAVRRWAAAQEAERALAWHRVREEVTFLLVFRSFWERYHRLATPNGEEAWRMRAWPDLQAFLESDGLFGEGLADVAELGFATGHVTRAFSAAYYRKMDESGGANKDFLRHRVLVFGSALTPERLVQQGVARFGEYEQQLDMRLSPRLRRQIGYVLHEYLHHERQVRQEPDHFLAGFWSGYYLWDLREQALRDAAPAE